MPEEEKERIPLNFMVDEFMKQQLITLNKREEKKDDDTNADGSAG